MLKKIYNILLIISFPVIYINNFLSKFFYIKYGSAEPHRIGHLVGEMTLWHLEKKNNEAGNKNKANLEIWYTPRNVCNKFFYKKIKKKVFITHNFIIKFLHDLFIKFNKREFIITGPKFGERDIESLITKNKNIIEFTDEEIKYGNSLLKEMGFDENQSFVCICIRDKYYLNKVLPKKDWSNSDFKNSNIENYNMAVKYLNDKNIRVIRMGAGSEKNWSLSDGKNFDYSQSKFRSGFLDFYLVHKSKFVISNGTGFYWVPYVLKKPIVMADFIPVGSLCSYVPNSIHIFKHIYSNDKKRFLNLKELLSDDYNYVWGTKDYIKQNLKIVDNTPEEVFECVKDMNLKIDGTLNEFDENKINQKKFWENLPKIIVKKENKQRHGVINAEIGNSFLKKYIKNFK